jgi:hypothetical protein
MKTKKGPKGIKSFFVPLKSVDDLARMVCNLSSRSEQIFAVKSWADYQVFAFGEKLDGGQIVYGITGKKPSKYLLYEPSKQSEAVSMRDDVAVEMQNYKSYKVEIAILKDNLLTPAKEKGKQKIVELEDYGSIIRKMVARFAGEDEIGKVYSFESKGKRYIGTFHMIGDRDDTIFAYAEVKEKEPFSFFRYNYNENSIAAVSSFSENSYPHVRVINLKEPFWFFGK